MLQLKHIFYRYFTANCVVLLQTAALIPPVADCCCWSLNRHYIWYARVKCYMTANCRGLKVECSVATHSATVRHILSTIIKCLYFGCIYTLSYFKYYFIKSNINTKSLLYIIYYDLRLLYFYIFTHLP